MKIIADENIPLVFHYFGHCGEIILKSGRSITVHDVKNADILLVRSVTPINKSLLENSSVKFIGSATTGSDHLDATWLNQSGISWAIAKGSNANAVAEYVVAVIASLQKQGQLTNTSLRAGIIGAGNIGSHVSEILKIFGFDVIIYDPFRMDEDNFISTPLNQWNQLDFITLHAPLTRTGPHPTYHLIGKNFLSRQKPGCVLLNTSRGSVINFADLKNYGRHLTWCLDVWENEPDIDLDVLTDALIATPHIAGYSVQGKFRGIEMLYQAAVEKKIIPAMIKTSAIFPRKKLDLPINSAHWQDVVLAVYDPNETSLLMKKALLNKMQTFDALRKHFVERYEFEFVDVNTLLSIDQSTMLKKLGFSITHDR